MRLNYKYTHFKIILMFSIGVRFNIVLNNIIYSISVLYPIFKIYIFYFYILSGEEFIYYNIMRFLLYFCVNVFFIDKVE